MHGLRELHGLGSPFTLSTSLSTCGCCPRRFEIGFVLKDELEKVFPRTSALADSGFTFMRQNTEAFGKILLRQLGM